MKPPAAQRALERRFTNMSLKKSIATKIQKKRNPLHSTACPAERQGGALRCCSQFLCHGFCSNAFAAHCFLFLNSYFLEIKTKNQRAAANATKQKTTPKKLPEAILT